MGKLRNKLANFNIQKAQKFTIKKLVDRKGNPKFRALLKEPKLDGLRGIIIVRLYKDKATYNAYTSSGVSVVNARYLLEAIAKAAVAGKFLSSKGFVLDGEFLSKNWNDTNSAVSTQTFIPKLADGLLFNAFDIIPLQAWDNNKCVMPLYLRKAILRAVIKKINSALFQIVSSETIDATPKNVEKLMQVFVKQGFEGMMLKDLDGLYEFRKSNAWLKLKPYLEDDFKIVGVKIGTGKYSKCLGALLVAGKVGKKKIATNVGGGLSDKQRKDFWAMHKKGQLIGKIVEVKHEGVTVKNSLRFPRVYRLRLDKVKL